MNKKLMAYLASGILLLGVATNLGAYRVHAAQAAAGDMQGTVQTAAEQKPVYKSSIQVANQQDTDEKENSDNEVEESKTLKSMAKISEEQAKAAALKVIPGKVTEISLDNEDGNVVYSVEVKTTKNVVEVKVDAGNGQVLAQENDKSDDSDQNEKDNDNGHENDTHEGNEEPDNDNVQLEQ